MPEVIEPETERLKLRQWKKEDYPVFAIMNADPVVMEYFPNILNESESNEMADKIQSIISARGWGFWAVGEKNKGNFIGFVGLHVPIPGLPCSPCVEIGWRLRKESWGKGYALEAAQAALKVAFEKLGFNEVYSFTAVGNFRSRAVIERLYMTNTQQNFEHPMVPVGNPLREHVLYKLTKDRWVRYAFQERHGVGR